MTVIDAPLSMRDLHNVLPAGEWLNAEEALDLLAAVIPPGPFQRADCQAALHALHEFALVLIDPKTQRVMRASPEGDVPGRLSIIH